MSKGSDNGRDDLQSKAAEMVKRAITVGVGAIFLTEESLRGMISEFKIPKELLGGILDSAGKTKDEFLQRLSQDLVASLKNKVDPRAMLEEILHKYEFEISLRMRVNPKEPRKGKSGAPTAESDAGAKLKVKARVREGDEGGEGDED